MTPDSRYRRRSIRIPAYDYSGPGAYFVTVVTQDRKCLFGLIDGGRMKLSEQGHIADECWRAIPGHFPQVELGAYAIMPNHIHGILIVHDRADGTSARRGTPWRAPTVPTVERVEQFGKPVAGSLATIIRQYKSSVTRKVVGQFGGAPRIWQRNYYEHIIRNDGDWNRIHMYVESNIANWAEDEENPTG